MNNNRQSLTDALSAFQTSLEKTNILLANSFKPSILDAQAQLLLNFQHSITEIMAISPQINLAAQMQAQRDILIAPFQEIVKRWNDSTLLAFRESLLNDSLRQQSRMMQDNFSSFASAFQGIAIYENYVTIPEVLIPSDFEYEEILNHSAETEEPACEKSTVVKRLSFSDALVLISLITSLLLWLLAPFYNHAVDCILSKEETTVPDPSMTEEQAQQILDYLSELTDYQQSILTALEVSEESVQELDSYSDDTQPHSAISDSDLPENDKLLPASADEPSNSK